MNTLQKNRFTENDQRKDRLFAGFQKLIDANHKSLGLDQDDKIVSFKSGYEGLATATKNTNNTLRLRLEDGNIIQAVACNTEILENLNFNKDTLYLEVGYLHNRWWIIHIVSILTELNNKNSQGEVHMSINPTLIQVPEKRQINRKSLAIGAK